MSSTIDDEELETAGMTVIRVGLGVTADLERNIISELTRALYDPRVRCADTKIEAVNSPHKKERW